VSVAVQVLAVLSVMHFCSGPELDDDDDEAENEAVNGDAGDTKSKSLQQKTGEAMLRHILNNDCVDGTSYSFR